MLCKLAWQNQTDSSLNLSGCDSGLLVVTGQRSSLHSNLFKNVSNERVQNGHGLGGDTRVGVHLLQDLCKSITTLEAVAQDVPKMF